MNMVNERLSANSSFSAWKWCALATLVIVILSLAPQLHFWFVRGSEWKGSFTVVQGDELLYSGYVNALIDGRPRRTDPVIGRDDHPNSPLPESLFSIQFIPPYAIAFFAKAFGMSASSSFIALLALEGLLASLALCWLFSSITGDERLAALGVLFVLCFGTLVGGQGIVGLIFKPDVRFVGLPFLRRYEPGVPFPLCFVFVTLLWKALTATSKRAMIVSALAAGVTIGALVFSYFYLWTTALAWFAGIAILWIVMRSFEISKALVVLACVVAPLAVSLISYARLLSHLPTAVDKAQVLTFTHAPDLLRVPEIIGAVILGLLFIAARRGKVQASDPRLILVASFGLLPFLVFNQQIITGRSLQPFHYEVFITNYLVLVGVIMLAKLLNVAVRPRAAFLLVLLCILWGSIEVGIPAPLRSRNDARRDQMIPVLQRLNELARTDGTWEDLRNRGRTVNLVFSPEYEISRLLPTWAPQGLFIGTGAASFQSLSPGELKRWIFMHLYYSGKNEDYLRELLNDRADDPFLTYFVRSTFFGPERILSFLSFHSQPVSQAEIEKEVNEFGIFLRSFSHSDVLSRPMTYLVTRTDDKSDLSRFDLWYERDAGETVGDYTLYRVKLRPMAATP